jgi:hypothetical protein
MMMMDGMMVVDGMVFVRSFFCSLLSLSFKVRGRTTIDMLSINSRVWDENERLKTLVLRPSPSREISPYGGNFPIVGLLTSHGSGGHRHVVSDGVCDDCREVSSSGAPMTMTDDATYLCCMGEGK